MFCEIITLRDNGLRLRSTEWPAPIRGRLKFVQLGGQAMAARRSQRVAELMTEWGTTSVPSLHLFDPELVDVAGDALLLRGYVIKADANLRATEYQQLWLTRPCMTLDSPPLPAFDPSQWVRQLPVEESTGKECSISEKWLAAHPGASAWTR